jgi:hypothetical protein
MDTTYQRSIRHISIIFPCRDSTTTHATNISASRGNTPRYTGANNYTLLLATGGCRGDSRSKSRWGRGNSTHGVAILGRRRHVRIHAVVATTAAYSIQRIRRALGVRVSSMSRLDGALPIWPARPRRPQRQVRVALQQTNTTPPPLVVLCPSTAASLPSAGLHQTTAAPSALLLDLAL